MKYKLLTSDKKDEGEQGRMKDEGCSERSTARGRRIQPLRAYRRAGEVMAPGGIVGALNGPHGWSVPLLRGASQGGTKQQDQEEEQQEGPRGLCQTLTPLVWASGLPWGALKVFDITFKS